MGYDVLRIRDVSRLSGQWVPPIGALGGPPAHELYTDLVAFAGLQLFRDSRARPWVVLLDGAHRRAFPVPSAELLGALDRFRMRRNVRPLPEGDIEEFVRIVEARVTDPDVEIPTLTAPVIERTSASGPEPRELASAPEARPRARTTERSRLAASIDPRENAAEHHPFLERILRPGSPGASAAPLSPSSDGPVNVAISGGRSGPVPPDPGLARYVQVLRRLLHDGDWMGTTRELSDATGDDPLTLYGSMLRYRSELADNDILLSYVEVDGSFRWLVVDRANVRDPVRASPPAGSALPAA